MSPLQASTDASPGGRPSAPSDLPHPERDTSPEGFDPVRVDRTRLVYEQAPFGLVATVINAVLLTLVESPFVLAGVAWGWCGAVCLVTAARWWLVRRFNAASIEDQCRPA